MNRIKNTLREINSKVNNIDYNFVEVVIETFILICYAFFICVGFINSSKFSVAWEGHFNEILKYIMMSLVVAKLSLSNREGIKSVGLIVLMMLLILISRAYNGYDYLCTITLLIIALRGIDFKKILKVFLITMGAMLTITVLSAAIGMIENLVYTWPRYRRRRISFGICYPTDFAAYIFFFCLAWVAFRGKKITYIELSLIGIAGVGVYYYCDARLDTICLLLVAIGFAIIKVFEKLADRKQRTNIFPNWFMKLGCMAVPACAGFIILVSRLYSENIQLLSKLNSLLSGRLAYGRQGFSDYGVKLCGQYIELKGNGGTTLYYLRESFYLDASYLIILLRYGVLVLIVVLILFTGSALRAYKKADYRTIAILAILAIQCMVEHHMLEVNYNPFIFMFLAGITIDRCTKKTQVEVKN